MFWLPILISFLSLIFLANIKPAIAASPTFGLNILVSTIGNSNSTSGPPILDVDVAGGVYIAWVGRDSNNSTDVFFSKLSPGGSNFENTEPLTEINDQKSSAQIEEDDGNIYIAWNERRLVDGVVKQGVFFTKSTNKGQTFSEEIFIDTAVVDLFTA